MHCNAYDGNVHEKKRQRTDNIQSQFYEVVEVALATSIAVVLSIFFFSFKVAFDFPDLYRFAIISHMHSTGFVSQITKQKLHPENEYERK